MDLDTKILVTDDEPENLRVVGKILKRDDLDFIFATSGPETIEAVEEYKPSLVLLDVMMPGMSGIEVCKKLKSEDSTKDIPVIFLTAKSQSEDVIEGFSAGGVDYVTKPFQREELLSRIHTHLKLYIANKRSNLLLERKRDLLSRLAHDVKNPAGATAKLCDLLIEDIDSDSLNIDELKSCLNIIRSSARGLTSLVNDTLDEEEGELDAVLRSKDGPIDVSDVVKHIVDLNRVTALEKSIRIDYQSTSKILINASRRVLTEIFDNLVNNAVKYSAESSEILVRLTRDESTDRLHFEVNDCAEIIDEDRRERLFRKYVKEEKSVSSTIGTSHGIGLSIVKRLVSMLDGEVGISSRLDRRGNRFYVSLPIGFR